MVTGVSMTHAERLALRHAINLLLSATDTEKVIHRERLRQAREAVVAELDAEQQKADEAAAYVAAWDARSRKLAEMAAANLTRSVGGN